MITVLQYDASADGRHALSALIAAGFVVCDHSTPRQRGGCALVVMHHRDELDDVLQTAAPDRVESPDGVVIEVVGTRGGRGWATTWAPPTPWRAQLRCE